ncbi:MAG TPA: choice-of-anchor Q domain-containing protein [Tepidisphaeraceae bacterium]|nr:choice-of-anchor Q domain-containing protein [Tepidisphaeraceae bacterium]
MYIVDSSIVISHCSLTVNHADEGGAVYAGNSSVEIDNCVFSDNQGIGPDSQGGAIYNYESTVDLISCAFDANAADFSGAVENDQTSLSVVNCTFVGNVAYGSDGESYFGGYGGAIDGYDSSDLTITNCTFTDNAAENQYSDGDSTYYGRGGAVSVEDSEVTIANSILWGDTAGVGPEFYYSESSEWNISNTTIEDPNFATGTNNDNDPQFVLAPVAGEFGWGSPDDNFGDLHLQATSPAIDAGDNSAIPECITTDFDGNPRVVGGYVDLGAYELNENVIYVDVSATGTGDGSNWINADPSLTDALNHAISGEIIRVAGGTYEPTSTGDRTASFDISDGVSLYGGYDAGNLDILVRDISQNPSVLSGDIGSGGIDSNSYHVVYAGNVSGARLDGFTISGGHANGDGTNQYGGAIYNNGGDLVIANCSFTGNAAEEGGAIFNAADSVITVTNCSFVANTDLDHYGRGGAIFDEQSTTILVDSTFDANSAGSGGAIENDQATLNATNCVFVGNIATGSYGQPYIGNQGGYGGAIDASNASDLTISNCTLTDNAAWSQSTADTSYYSYGGAINVKDSSLIITNSILWNDSAYTGSEVYYDESSIAVIYYTDIQDSDLSANNNNVDADPMFVRNPSAGADEGWGDSDDDYGDLRLLIGSPAIDGGNNSAVPDGINTDILGNPRIINAADTSDTAEAVVDMGAYETWPVYVDNNLISEIALGPEFSSISPAQGSPQTGVSWDDAYYTIQSALSAAQWGQMIFVASSDYYVSDSNASDSIQLVDGVSLFGGYDGATSGTPNNHDDGAQSTIIGQYDSENGYDVYHPVTAEDVGPLTVFDGFEVVEGNANGSGTDSNGGGMLIENGSPAVMNCSFYGVSAENNGGAIYISGGSPLIDNVTINGDSAFDGGAIYSTNASPIIENSILNGNFAGGAGGAIFVSSGSPIILNNSFSGNDASQSNNGTGGAIELDFCTDAQVADNTFTGNEAVTGGAVNIYDGSANFADNEFLGGNQTYGGSGNGGAIAAWGATIVSSYDGYSYSTGEDGGAFYVVNGSLTINSSQFIGNQASSGGAIYADNCMLTLNGVVFRGNSATGDGGAIYADYQTTIDASKFEANSAVSGGAIYALVNNVQITNSIFVANQGMTGAVINATGATLTIDNDTITGNTATDDSGALYVAANSDAVITNSILWNDSAPNNAEIGNNGSILSVTYTDIGDTLLGSGAGDIDADPNFVRSPGTNGSSDYGDLHLQSASPAVNSGDVTLIPAGITVDIDGNPRVALGQLDMGAYQHQIVYVDAGATGDDDGSSWADAYTTLTEALANLGDSFMVEVAGGTYFPSDSGDPNASFSLPSGVQVFGGYAGSNDSGSPDNRDMALYPSILSGKIGNGAPSNSYSVVYAHLGNYSTRLDGFTIEYGAGGDSSGAGVYITQGSLTIANCNFMNNGDSSTSGGAIAIHQAGALTVLNSTFTSDMGADGGAIYASFANSLDVESCTFVSETSSDLGGAIYIGSVSDTSILDCVFDGNTAPSGGAVYIDGTSADITNSVFVSNVAEGFNDGDTIYSGVGGAIDIANGGLSIADCTFANNSAVSMLADGASTPSYGGAIYLSDAGVDVTNSILWNDQAAAGNEAYIVPGGELTIANSDIQDSTLANGGTDNLFSDPLFVRNPGTNGSTDYGDLHLQPNSPAIDTGDNSAIPGGITTDLDGNPRIVDGVVDMGAYEAPPSP